MAPIVRVAIYCRVSGSGQRDRHTIESQLREVPDYCRRQGWTIVETYVDDGKSASTGKLGKRDAFARLVADAALGRFDAVAVVDQNRITRTSDLRERGAILGAFQAAGVKVVITTTGQILDYRTDMGDLLGSLGAYFSALENKKRQEAFDAGRRTVVIHGGKPRGSTPIGLLYTRPDRKRGIPPSWAIDPAWAPTIREVYERVAAGEATFAIAYDLECRGVERPRGGEWVAQQVIRMVKSPVYTGRLCVEHGQEVSVPAIIDEELAARARTAILARYRQPAPRQKHYHLLAGIVRCERCGQPIGVGDTMLKAPRRRASVYRCRGRRRPTPDRARCDLPLVLVRETDERVWDTVVAALCDPKVVERAIAQLRTDVAAPPDPGEARAELERIDQATAATLAQLVAGDITQAVSNATVTALARRRREYERALDTAIALSRGIRSVSAADLVARVLDGFRRNAPGATPQQRRAILRAATERAVMSERLIALDLAIDVDSRSDDGPAQRPRRYPGHPVRLGQVSVLPAYSRRSA